MKRLFLIFAAAAASMMVSCKKENTINPETGEGNTPNVIVTKAVGDKTPHTLVYVETNDVNPLNAGDYYLGENTFFDYVCLFASNIHKTTVDGVVQPTLYFNPELAPYLCCNGTGVEDYIEPLQDKGIGVLLGVLGDWQNIGLSNMNTTQQEQFATILAYVIEQCGLDGVVFDDEYSGTASVVNGSYSNIILKLRQLLPDTKIVVFDWGGTSYISSTAAAQIDYANHGYFGGYYLSTYYSNITGMNNARWSPISLELGGSYTYSTSSLSTWASNAVNNTYGEMMFFNLRPISDYNPTSYLQALATGAGWGTVTCNNGDRAQDITPIEGGCTVTYAMATAN